MKRGKHLNGIARMLAARTGANERATEVRNHLDEAIEHGNNASIADVASLVLLCVRAAFKRATSNMASTVALTAGLAFAGFGLFVLIAPYVSVSRLSNQSLAELPEISGAEVDARGALAIFDSDDFVLATRIYESTSEEDVSAALLDAGFGIAYGTTPSQNGFGLDCCGDYDQLIVHLETVGADTVATTTARDTDVTIAWGLFLFLGLFSLIVGLCLITAGRRLIVSEVGLTPLRP